MNRSHRPEPQLAVDKLTVVYSRTARAVDGLSFQVGRGEVVALLGPNGAGKTSTLRALTGFLPGDRARIVAGSILLDGFPLQEEAPHKAARRGVALIPERDKVFATLSVEENLRLGALANPKRQDVPRLRRLVSRLFPILDERMNQAAGYLSGGERQMLAISAALLSGPKLLMVDELSLGLAPRVVGELIDVLKQLNLEEGLTILLVEQSAVVAFAIAQYVYVLNVGRSVLEGRPDQLRTRSDFNQSYLGLGRARAAAGVA